MAAQFVEFLDRNLLPPDPQHSRRQVSEEPRREANCANQFQLRQFLPESFETYLARFGSQVVQRHSRNPSASRMAARWYLIVRRFQS
jgi:hypothetical protein